MSDKERKSENDALFRDIVQILVDKCVNPTTSRPYTSGVLERALRTVHFSVELTRSAKQQALLTALPLLQEVFQITRARMRFRVLISASGLPALEALLCDSSGEHAFDVESREACPPGERVTLTADPGALRVLETVARENSGRVEVLSLAVHDGAGGEASTAIPSAICTAPSMHQQNTKDPAKHETVLTALREAIPQRSPDPPPTVVYRGPIDKLGEAHASRRERFLELDKLQLNWTVELRERTIGGVVEAVFFAPDGKMYPSFAHARLQALQASQHQ